MGLESWFSEIVISEEFGSAKPTEQNYRHFEQAFPSENFVYVGDNLAKDFVTPNRLGWTTVALLDRGENIHPQDWEQIELEFKPQFLVEKLA